MNTVVEVLEDAEGDEGMKMVNPLPRLTRVSVKASQVPTVGLGVF